MASYGPAFLPLVTVLVMSAASGAQITVVATPALAPALPALAREFESTSSHSITLSYVTAGAMRNAVTGANVDVAISTAPAIDELQAEGRILSAGRRDIARVGLGVQARKGAWKPDISTVEAFRRAIVAARSIGYIDPASGGAAGLHAARLMKQLSIAEMVAAKTRLVGGAALTRAVAEGEIDLGLAPISEIVSDPRIELVGPVPSELQEVTILTAAVTRSSSVRDAAQAFIHFLAGPGSTTELTVRGLK